MELAPVSDPGLVVPTIARVLGLREESGGGGGEEVDCTDGGKFAAGAGRISFSRQFSVLSQKQKGLFCCLRRQAGACHGWRGSEKKKLTRRSRRAQRTQRRIGKTVA